MSTCKSCGAEITWARTENGKKIPLSVESAETRFILKSRGGATAGDTVKVAVSRPTYISHFADCPDADKWRKE